MATVQFDDVFGNLSRTLNTEKVVSIDIDSCHIPESI